jgi:hypothetical protein
LAEDPLRLEEKRGGRVWRKDRNRCENSKREDGEEENGRVKGLHISTGQREEEKEREQRAVVVS